MKTIHDVLDGIENLRQSAPPSEPEKPFSFNRSQPTQKDARTEAEKEYWSMPFEKLEALERKADNWLKENKHLQNTKPRTWKTALEKYHLMFRICSVRRQNKL